MDGWYGASVPDGNGCPVLGCSPKSPLWNGRSCHVSHLSIPAFSSNKLQSGPQRLTWQIDLESLLTFHPCLAFPLRSTSSRVRRRWKNNGLYYRSCSSGKMIKGWVGKWMIRPRRTKKKKTILADNIFKCILYWKSSRNAGDMGTNPRKKKKEMF